MDLNTELSPEIFSKLKDHLFDIIVVIVALLIANGIYKSQLQKMNALVIQKDEEIKKNEVLREINSSTNSLSLVKKAVNNKDISSVINTLGNIAKNNDARIISVGPGEKSIGPLFTQYPFSLTLESYSYHKLAKFISALENHPDIYSIDSLSIKQEPDTRPDGRSLGGNKMVVQIAINTILLNDQ